MKINTNWICIGEQSPGGLQYEEKEEDSNDAMEEPDERKYSTSPVRHGIFSFAFKPEYLFVNVLDTSVLLQIMFLSLLLFRISPHY